MATSKSQATPVQRRAYRVNEACVALGICRSSAYVRMNSGEIPYAVICGRRHIAAEVIEALVKGEHPSQAQPKPVRRKQEAAS
jgi:predicted DNA-binding transcriptional regulator AlpA